MTAGQAGTEVAGLHIFYKAFVYLKFGPATAMAWILGRIAHLLHRISTAHPLTPRI